MQPDTDDKAAEPLVTRSTGIATGVGGFIAGGGYSGATETLDNTVQTAANGMAEWGGDVEIRFNSNRQSGGAWLVTARNGQLDSNCEVGINAHAEGDGCVLRINRGALANPSVLPASETGFDEHFNSPEEAAAALRSLALPADEIRAKIAERDAARARYAADLTEFIEHPRGKGAWYVRDMQRAAPVTIDAPPGEGTWLIAKGQTYRVLSAGDDGTLNLVSTDWHGNPRLTTASMTKVVELGTVAITHFPSQAPVLPTETFPR